MVFGRQNILEMDGLLPENIQKYCIEPPGSLEQRRAKVGTEPDTLVVQSVFLDMCHVPADLNDFMFRYRQFDQQPTPSFHDLAICRSLQTIKSDRSEKNPNRYQVNPICLPHPTPPVSRSSIRPNQVL